LLPPADPPTPVPIPADPHTHHGHGGAVDAPLPASLASQFFYDAPIAVMPASWQDTGSGVFTLAATGLLAGLGPLERLPARRTTTYAVTAALAAARLADRLAGRGCRRVVTIAGPST
jgi:hypothetical protein